GSIIQRNPNSFGPGARSCPPEHGVTACLALTFGTLLSSQVSDAHRVPAFRPRLGATRSTLERFSIRSQIRVAFPLSGLALRFQPCRSGFWSDSPYSTEVFDPVSKPAL